jgi:hypothetical protein
VQLGVAEAAINTARLTGAVVVVAARNSDTDAVLCGRSAYSVERQLLRFPKSMTNHSPFTLSLSKGFTAARAGFDRLSPNGVGASCFSETSIVSLQGSNVG